MDAHFYVQASQVVVQKKFKLENNKHLFTPIPTYCIIVVMCMQCARQSKFDFLKANRLFTLQFLAEIYPTT